MKWLLLIGLIFLIANRRYLVGDLIRTAKKLPKDFKDGQQRVDDPVAAAKDVTTDATKSDPPT